ncbi:MAG: c-type cytochrome [Halioglobus sp.]
MQWLFAAVCTGLALAAMAAPNEITLPADTSTLRESTLPGYAIAQQKCGICHSADYISYQPPGMSLEQWTQEMHKMQHSYGAPITPEDIEQLGAYLAVAYGSASENDPAVVALTESALAAKAASATAARASGSAAGAAADDVASDAEVQELLNRNACYGCHAIEQKKVGPSFKDVAARYAGEENAQARLAASIRQGGSGKWGPVPMPPQMGLGEADLAALAGFILKQ